jgi:uncharacterized protein with HEPN domain
MRPEARAYLHDIDRAAQLIGQFRQGKSFDHYLSDALLRSGVERQLEIIGEAVSKLSDIDPMTAAGLTDRRRIIALRNILIHGYARVDDRVIWNILDQNLPVLQAEVGALLAG